ncbi:hypothetical protein, partial [Escherichia coli]|uniref:hypothetical protein n=1 Tax=Escherichia coli TaxID=562 RepID=UPI0015968BFE
LILFISGTSGGKNTKEEILSRPANAAEINTTLLSDRTGNLILFISGTSGGKNTKEEILSRPANAAEINTTLL